MATGVLTDADAMRTRLAQVKDTLDALRQRVNQAEARHERDASEARDYYERCNALYDIASPMAKTHDHWLHIGQVARRVGLAASFAVPVVTALSIGAHIVGPVAFLADVAVIGACMLGVQRSRRVTNDLGPKVDALVDQWKLNQERMERARASAEGARGEVVRLEGEYHKAEGERQVIEMALALPATPVSSGTVVRDDDSVRIGNLRVPRRVTAG